MYDFGNAGKWTKRIIDDYLKEGMTAVDATMGNGHDTLYLCERVGQTGRVIAFDVQKQALINTEARLLEAGMRERAKLILDSHENMDAYLDGNPDLIMFNLGWLPGTPHETTTRVETTLRAVNKALGLLKKGGLMTVCVYPGHEEGMREKTALLAWAADVDAAAADVWYCGYQNIKANPPVLIALSKKEK